MKSGRAEDWPIAEILLRRLAAADAAAYHAFRIAALRATPEAFTSTWQEEAARPLDWSIRRIETNFILGAFDGRLCGTAGLSVPARRQERHKATLFGMAVAASRAGRGIGRRLVERILSQAATLPHVTQVILSVSEGNDAAERLYRSCGFDVYGREPRAVVIDGKPITKLHMIRLLDARPASSAPRSVPTSSPTTHAPGGKP